MELSELEKTLNKAIRDYRKILPFRIREIQLDKISQENCGARSLNKKDFEDFKENWEAFINDLDKFWNQLNAMAKHHAGEKKDVLMGFLGSENKKRTSEQVLVYLDKARNSSTHTLWVHMRQSAPMEVISGHGATIKFLPNGVEVSGPGDSAKELAIIGPGLFLLSEVKVVEKKKEVIYELPIKYFDYPLRPLERVLPQIIGKFGLIYYMELFNEFKRRISDSGSVN